MRERQRLGHADRMWRGGHVLLNGGDYGGSEDGDLEGGGAARGHGGRGVPQARHVAFVAHNWRAVAQTAAGSALKRTDRRGQAKPDAEVARMQAELDRMRAAIAEITAENLEMKKIRRDVARARSDSTSGHLRAVTTWELFAGRCPT